MAVTKVAERQASSLPSTNLPSASVDSELVLFSSTTGKVLKRSTITGLLKSVSGVVSQAVAGTDYQAPITVGTTAPGSPVVGQLWVDTN